MARKKGRKEGRKKDVITPPLHERGTKTTGRQDYGTDAP